MLVFAIGQKTVLMLKYFLKTKIRLQREKIAAEFE
jgi:hypothetical protein